MVPVSVPVLVPVPASVPDPNIFSRAFQVSSGITTRLIPVVHPAVLLFHPEILSQSRITTRMVPIFHPTAPMLSQVE